MKQTCHIAFALLVTWMAGCAGPGYYGDAVRVTVSDIEVIEASMLEQLYRVTLRVQNRDDQAIEIRGGSFDLAINGSDFGSGVTDQHLSVAAFSDAKLEVRMVSTVFGMLRLIRGLQARDGEPLGYEISGRFSVGGDFGGLRFHEAGEITLPGSRADRP